MFEESHKITPQKKVPRSNNNHNTKLTTLFTTYQADLNGLLKSCTAIHPNYQTRWISPPNNDEANVVRGVSSFATYVVQIHTFIPSFDPSRRILPCQECRIRPVFDS